MAFAAFGRALGLLGVAIFAKGVSFFFVEFDFARFGIAVADFAIFKVVTMGFVVEADIAIFGFHYNGVVGKGNA